MKVGDTVRFLNTTGGGRISRIEGKIAYVDENGFETPVLMKDIVVVLPAGHDPAHKGANIMFDQKAFDDGKKNDAEEKEKAKSQQNPKSENISDEPPVETGYGDVMNLALAFEPADIKNLSKTRFSAVLVNDSNYFLDFIFMRRSDTERGWTVVFAGQAAPNELIDLAVFSHEDLPAYEKIALQAVAYKKEKSFSLQPPLNFVKKLDLTKFHKFHCFRPGRYFENPVIELQIIKDGLQVDFRVPDTSALKTVATAQDKSTQASLAQKYNVGSLKNKKSEKAAADNPHKLLPLQEIDLHIGELVDTTAGMEPKDMLGLQLDTVRRVMNTHARRKGQKIVFIHGKGDGVLRKEVISLLKKEYPKAEIQDASFREYGFGATLVTVH